MRGRMLLAVVGVLGLMGGISQAWEIELSVKEHGVAAGLRYVTGGVPLLEGQAKEVTDLHLASKDGRPVAAQFRELARWWRGDGSIRWVLVDFQTELADGETKTFVLTDKKLSGAKPPAELTVEDAGGAITVNTGAAKFVMRKDKFAFLDQVFVDGEQVLEGSPELGTVLEDTFGEKYRSSAGTKSVEVIEKGPMRVCVRARGQHLAAGGKGFKPGLYGYDYIMHFYAGSPEVWLDVVLTNNPAKSTGTPVFEDASLLLKLKGGATACRIYGEGAHDAKLADGGSFCLYQDSNGADTWERCPGVANMQTSGWKPIKAQCSSFRGYKVWQRKGGNEQEVAKGNHAAGTVHISGPAGGVVAHTRNFWRQFPKGVECSADGTLRLALFPREYKTPHFLEDASAKGHEIALHFYSSKKKTAPAGDPAAFGDLWESRVFPRPTLEHISACGALADQGPFSVPTQGLDKKPNNRTSANDKRMLSGDALYGNSYGWQVYGEKWRSCGGHSKHGARQPMNEDNYLYRWYVTGVTAWLYNGDARSRQFRDVRCYRIDDVDPFSYKDWDDFRAHNRSEDWTSRPQPKDAETEKYQQGRYSRTTWWLPNPAHMTMDLIYDRYLIMGDMRAFENLRIIGAHGGYYAGYRKPVVHRATGWSWRALYRYWELTGDKDAEKLMGVAIKNFKNMVDAGDIPFPMKKDKKTGKQIVNWWFTFVFSRAAAMNALHTGDPDALEICKKMAAAIEAKSKAMPTGYGSGAFVELHAVLYHLTGDEKYKKLVLGEGDGEGLRKVTAGMRLPGCAHWLVNQPPKGK